MGSLSVFLLAGILLNTTHIAWAETTLIQTVKEEPVSDGEAKLKKEEQATKECLEKIGKIAAQAGMSANELREHLFHGLQNPWNAQGFSKSIGELNKLSPEQIGAIKESFYAIHSNSPVGRTLEQFENLRGRSSGDLTKMMQDPQNSGPNVQSMLRSAGLYATMREAGAQSLSPSGKYVQSGGRVYPIEQSDYPGGASSGWTESRDTRQSSPVASSSAGGSGGVRFYFNGSGEQSGGGGTSAVSATSAAARVPTPMTFYGGESSGAVVESFAQGTQDIRHSTSNLEWNQE